MTRKELKMAAKWLKWAGIDKADEKYVKYGHEDNYPTKRFENDYLTITMFPNLRIADNNRRIRYGYSFYDKVTKESTSVMSYVELKHFIARKHADNCNHSC
jgi:hypothetical protein